MRAKKVAVGRDSVPEKIYQGFSMSLSGSPVQSQIGDVQ